MFVKKMQFLAGASILACGVSSHMAKAQDAQPVPMPQPSGEAKPATTDDSSVGDIIVTAQKRAQSINDVGLTIQAASQDTLSQRGITGPADLGKLVSGFTFTQSTYSTPVYTLRGVGLYDATFGAVPAVAIYTDQIPRNFPVMSEALNLDLERVEVLKGPQGTLFGQSATGGAINYITNKPKDKLEIGADLSYERFGRFDGSGYISGPITDTLKARLAVGAIQGGAWQRNTYRPNELSATQENGATRKLLGRLTVDWEPTDRLKIEASATGVRDRSDVLAPQYIKSVLNVYSAAALAQANASPATQNPFGVVNDALYAGITTPGSPNFDATFLGRQATLVGRLNSGDPTLANGARALLGTKDEAGNARLASWSPDLLGPSRNNYYQFTARGDYKLTDEITLTSISAVARQSLVYAQDLDATSARSGHADIFGSVRSFNQELRLSGQTSRLNWIVGANYDNSSTKQPNYYDLTDYSSNNTIPGLPTFTFTFNDFSSKIKSYAGYGNAEFKITPNLTVTGGIRYTQNNQSAAYCYSDPAFDTSQAVAQTFGIFQNLFSGQTLPPIQPGQCFTLGDGLQGTTFGRATITPLDLKLNEHNWSYRAGLNYKFDQGTLLYGTISQGYKAGIFSAIGASGTGQYAPATQEKVIAYEAGFKAPIADRKLFLNGAVFYYDYSNKQFRGRVLDPVLGLFEKDVNVPKSYVWGIEGSALAYPFAGLTFNANATYIKSKVSGDFSQTADGAAVYNAAGYTGNFKGSPLPFTPKFSGNVDVQYQWGLNSDIDAFVGANALYTGKQNATFNNSILLADDFEIKDYATLDLRAGIESADGRWRMSVFGKNVLNKFYSTSINTYLDTIFRYVGRPVTYGVTLKLKLL